MDRRRYALTRISGPADEIVTLQAVRDNARIDHSDLDADILRKIRAAREHFEERSDVSLITTRWRMAFDAFPLELHLYLPRWPLQSVEAITYETNGTHVEIDQELLRLRHDDHGYGRVALAGWQRWPRTDRTPDAVIVEFTAGWAEPSQVPETWRQAILAFTTWWIERPDGSDDSNAAIPPGIEALIQSAACIGDDRGYVFGG